MANPSRSKFFWYQYLEIDPYYPKGLIRNSAVEQSNCRIAQENWPVLNLSGQDNSVILVWK